MTEDPYRSSAKSSSDVSMVGFLIGNDFIYHNAVEKMGISWWGTGDIRLSIALKSRQTHEYRFETVEAANSARDKIILLRLESMKYFAQLQGGQKDE